MLEFLDDKTISILFDVLLIAAVIGLWVLWAKQVQQRKQIEQTLVEASTQLQEATLMLNQALVQIHDLQSAGGNQAAVTDGVDEADEAKADEATEAIKQKVQARIDADAEVGDEPSSRISQVARMLRLQREGESAEKIAETLDMPLAQVKLMLMLQSNSKA